MNPQLIHQYREAAEKTGNADPKEANKGALKLVELYRELSKTSEGQKEITTLLSDKNPYVRSWAAAHTLQWDPDRARPVLEALRDSKESLPVSFDAEMTLKEFDAGRLKF